MLSGATFKLKFCDHCSTGEGGRDRTRCFIDSRRILLYHITPVYLAVCVNFTAICECNRRSEFKNRKPKHAKGRYGSLLNFNLLVLSSVAIDVFSL